MGNLFVWTVWYVSASIRRVLSLNSYLYTRLGEETVTLKALSHLQEMYRTIRSVRSLLTYPRILLTSGRPIVTVHGYGTAVRD